MEQDDEMQQNFVRTIGLALVASSLVAVGCAKSETDSGQIDTAAGAAAANSAVAPDTSGNATAPVSSDMRLEVDVNARQLKVFRSGQQVATHAVAVGSEKWPTKTGEWTVKQVVFNPDWTPPDESWAEEREPRESGDPKNPLGHAQLVYDAPRSIHGTNAPSSIGKPVSHGSIRLPNEVIVALAKDVMEAGGAAKDASWIQQAQQNKRQKQVVDLPRPVPIRVY